MDSEIYSESLLLFIVASKICVILIDLFGRL